MSNAISSDSHCRAHIFFCFVQDETKMNLLTWAITQRMICLKEETKDTLFNINTNNNKSFLITYKTRRRLSAIHSSIHRRIKNSSFARSPSREQQKQGVSILRLHQYTVFHQNCLKSYVNSRLGSCQALSDD